jgi:glycosyltransferase involved in cell wall biosynthesis
MKKVLVCRFDLLPYSETFIREQVLAYSSWSPVLVGMRRTASGLPLDGLDVRILDDPTPTFIGEAYRRLLRLLGIAAPGAMARLRREAASLIHVHFATDAVAYWPLIRRLGLPVVITLHGYDIHVYREFWERGFQPSFYKKYPRRLLALATQDRVHFIAVSESIKRRAVEYGIPPERISVRYIGIDLARFHFAGRPICERRRRILYVGRMVEKKGGAFLLRAYARVRATIPDAELVMIGDGPLMDSYTKLAADLNIPVAFLGSLPSSEVKQQIDEARVFCLPSITAQNGDAEGLAIVILEAQASGVPVVTSAGAGAAEGIIEGTTGFAFAEKDIVTLGERLIQLLLDDELISSMSHDAPRFMAERFDIRYCTKSLENLYEILVEAK